VIEELIQLAKDMRAPGGQIGTSDDELAFHDALPHALFVGFTGTLGRDRGGQTNGRDESGYGER
jgi:hypothetical protein